MSASADLVSATIDDTLVGARVRLLRDARHFIPTNAVIRVPARWANSKPSAPPPNPHSRNKHARTDRAHVTFIFGLDNTRLVRQPHHAPGVGVKPKPHLVDKTTSREVIG